MFDIRVNLKLSTQLASLVFDATGKQMRYAASQALQEVARNVQAEERANMQRRIKGGPVAFTKNAVRVPRVPPGQMWAQVIMQDITAAYMAPYEFGGRHKLIGKGITWFNPKHVKLNKYGNIPNNTITRLIGGLVKGRTGAKQVARKAGIFVGKLKGRGGRSTSGVWRRLPGNRLQLIVAFGDAHPPNFRLKWFDQAQQTVQRRFNRAFTIWVAKAISSRRP